MESILSSNMTSRKVGRPLGSFKENNKSENAKYYRDYYHDHMAMIIQCPKCKSYITKSKYPRHTRSLKCINYI
jgi:hypothetical protein